MPRRPAGRSPVRVLRRDDLATLTPGEVIAAVRGGADQQMVAGCRLPVSRQGDRLMSGRSLPADEGPRMPAPDGVPLPQRYWAILTIALGLTLAVLDGSIANVALPTIARDVHASPVGVDLGGERLPARGDHLAAAARLAGRDLRLPAHLPGRAGGVHHRLAALRAVVVAAHADRSPASSRASAPPAS